ncbi:hypothetical protein FA95DRAFT_1573168 [Auriscalpium vulgare]|uniref:Uncharacterized protein n=1 Tax=Auriscalpium vulgare TaxID=40419 RepID=A0ACB8RSD9_9AGAM|nr:hypothetical protein FA95DRAFT_1573168 [Auriscalpium vulgare]
MDIRLDAGGNREGHSDVRLRFRPAVSSTLTELSGTPRADVPVTEALRCACAFCEQMSPSSVAVLTAHRQGSDAGPRVFAAVRARSNRHIIAAAFPALSASLDCADARRTSVLDAVVVVLGFADGHWVLLLRSARVNTYPPPSVPQTLLGALSPAPYVGALLQVRRSPTGQVVANTPSRTPQQPTSAGHQFYLCELRAPRHVHSSADDLPFSANDAAALEFWAPAFVV